MGPNLTEMLKSEPGSILTPFDPTMEYVPPPRLESAEKIMARALRSAASEMMRLMKSVTHHKPGAGGLSNDHSPGISWCIDICNQRAEELEKLDQELNGMGCPAHVRTIHNAVPGRMRRDLPLD